MLSGTRWTHFITVRSPITEVSVRPSAERFSPLPSCCSETAYEEHGVGPEPHTHPLMVVIGGAVSHWAAPGWASLLTLIKTIIDWMDSYDLKVKWGKRLQRSQGHEGWLQTIRPIQATFQELHSSLILSIFLIKYMRSFQCKLTQ